jgi:hypothetical protein
MISHFKIHCPCTLKRPIVRDILDGLCNVFAKMGSVFVIDVWQRLHVQRSTSRITGCAAGTFTNQTQGKSSAFRDMGR